MKKIAKSLLFTLAIFLILPQNALASFSDVSSSNKNYDAIIYLQENGIIEGYSDGSFRPTNNVNRAEFLKIIIEGSDIDTDTTATAPFKDVESSSWYAKYINKAYSEGWIVGYSDNTFKPSQTISKAEAIKILGEVQNWELPTYVSTKPFDDVYKTAWYTPYVAYAKEHGFLEESSGNFSPDNLMSRAGISEIIYRSLVGGVFEEQTTDEITESGEEENNDPVKFSLISKSTFNDIVLNEDLPNIFYKNEVYMLSGTADSSEETATVIIEDSDNDYKKTFSAEISDSKFEIPIFFNQSGNFLIGMILGDSGSSKAKSISVLSNLPPNLNTATPPQELTNFSLKFKNNQTYLDLPENNNTLKKIVIKQGTKSVSYFSRQNTEKIVLNYPDFENFDEGTISVNISMATISDDAPLKITSSATSGNSENFSITQHQFSNIDKDLISVSPPGLVSKPQTISFSGKVYTNTNLKAYAIKPDGLVDSFELTTSSATISDPDFNSTLIKSGGSFSFSYNAKKTGTYILEINDDNGFAILNHPVYIGTSIPLIPDFSDLEEKDFFSGTLNLTKARNELLDYINDSRHEIGENSIELDSDLNNLAQKHSEDMADNNFLGHINLDGETPNDRRIAAGIKTAVSENIAKDTSIESAHFGLMRSAAHRENILDPAWTRVGLGIEEKNGYLYITEEFSFDEFSTSELSNLKTDLFDEINSARDNENLDSLTYNTTLETASKDLNDQSINEGKTITNDLLAEIRDKYDISGTLSGYFVSAGFWSSIVDSVIEADSIVLEDFWRTIGIDIQLDENGNIQTILLLNKP